MNPMTVGIISDTHGVFDDALKRFLEPCSQIWHAGDFGNIETADAIAAFRPLRGVYGNIDGGQTRMAFPEELVWDCCGQRIAMRHIGGYPGRYENAARELITRERPALFITGHSHILKVMFDRRNNLLYINPGAAGNSGFHNVRTAIRLKISINGFSDLEVGEWPRRGR